VRRWFSSVCIELYPANDASLRPLEKYSLIRDLGTLPLINQDTSLKHALVNGDHGSGHRLLSSCSKPVTSRREEPAPS